MKLKDVKGFLKANRYFLKAFGASLIVGCAIGEIYVCGSKSGANSVAFGTFKAIEKGALKMINPKTGEEIPMEKTDEWLKML